MPARPSRSARIVVSLALLLTVATPASAADPSGLRPRTAGDHQVGHAASDAEFVPGELIVRFEAGMSGSARRRAVDASGGRLSRALRTPRMAIVQLPANADARAAANVMARQAGVEYAEPNYLYRFSATPDDPRFAEMWGLHASNDHDIDAPAAWNVTTGSADVLVAVVDSGVDFSHPDLAGNIWTNPGEIADNGLDDDENGFIDDVHGWDFVHEDNVAQDNIGHGTHVAGTIGAEGDNGQGMTGVAWNVSLLPIRAGDVELEAVDVLEAFDYACQMGADIVNASFGGPSSFAVRQGITDCPGTLFVIAAGNSAKNVDNKPVYPCAYPDANIVCVAATDRKDRLAFFSNFGSTAVDLAAPGDSILSATPRQVLFADGFESSMDAWVVSSPSGKDWSRTTAKKASGLGSATDSKQGDYANHSNTLMRTAVPLDLQVGNECQLDYAVRYDLQLFDDWLLVEGREGSHPWRVIDSGADGDLAWTGSSDGIFVDWWEDLTADDFDGAGAFQVRFRLISNGSVRRDGAYVDDVAIHCVTGSHGSNDFVRFSGTSMAAPHVAGVAALMLSAYPDASVAELKAALLDGSDARGALDGKVRSGGRLNARGALDLLEAVAPVASEPTHRLVEKSKLSSSKVPIKVAWDAATDAAPSSGIDDYRLQLRSWDDGAWGSWSTVAKTAKLTATELLPPGRHQFRLRATDGAGNHSGWEVGDELLLRDAQGASTVDFTRTWSTQNGSSFYDGSTRYAGRLATATHSFTGKQVAWVASRGPNRGQAKVFIDGTLVETVDLYSATTKHRRVVFLQKWSTIGAHTIKIKVIAPSSESSSSRVDLDAFVTLR